MFSALLVVLKNIPWQIWAILALCIGGFLFIHHYTSQIDELVKTNRGLNAQVAQLKTDVKVCVTANAANADVIQKLSNDKQNAANAKTKVDGQVKKDRQNTQTIEHKIETAPATDDGPVAKVLKDTIDSIIANRKAKEAVK